MIANYHSHTWRCNHATGTEREYVENAIQNGLKILGFSDHTPMFYDGDHVNRSKMTPDQLEEYVETVLKLRDEYKDDIEIHVGLEVEYYPRYFERLVRFTEQYPIEYFLLGQHFVGNEIGEPWSGGRTEDPELLRRYCRQTAEAMETGCFSYFAHPDLINFSGDDDLYREEMRKLCLHAKKIDVPLEINFLGLFEHRNYPNPAFWKIAGEVGNKVVFGSDAHAADMVWNPVALADAEQMVKEFHLDLVDTVPLIRPVSKA